MKNRWSIDCFRQYITNILDSNLCSLNYYTCPAIIKSITYQFINQIINNVCTYNVVGSEQLDGCYKYQLFYEAVKLLLFV